MKTIKIGFLLMAVFALPGYAQALELGSARISWLDGDVQMRTVEAGDWVPAAINTPLDEGDELWVPEGGRMEFQLSSGTAVRLDQNSALQILTLERASSQFYLSEGHAYINHNSPRGNVIQFDTPVSSLRAYDKAIFRVDVPDPFTDLSVFTGWVDAEARGGKTRVNAGRTLTLGEDRDAELARIGRADEWQNWNVQRDQRFAARGDSYRYLPEELRPYSSDFDDNGRWVQLPEYGFVWLLRAIASDWAPYRVGQWMWRGGDYVWVSSEPWGWTPYHYGRWAFAPRIGWFWVPPQRGQVYWGPGYVGWVRTRDHVAWVPLAPREVYYGYGNYGPNSVDLRKRNIREINITNITYKNVQVTNSVTVINNNSFVTGRREAVNVKENLFLTEKINIGRPDIKPERASFAPVVKTIPPAQLPPQQVSRIQVQELKQGRQLVKEQNRSVINQGEAVKPLAVKTVEQPKSPAEKVLERKQPQLEKSKSEAVAETPRAKTAEESPSPSAATETKANKQPSPEPAVKQPESGREKAQQRKPTQPEKSKSQAAVETPRTKTAEKSVSPSAATETKANKQPSPEPAVKQPESGREKAQQRKPTQPEKGKSEAAVESPRAKTEQRDEKPVKAEGKQKPNAPGAEPESRLDPRDRKPAELKDKSAAPIKATETGESKGGGRLSREEKSVGTLEKKSELKGAKPTAAEQSRDSVERKAVGETKAKGQAGDDQRQLDKLEEDYKAERISRSEYENRKSQIKAGAVLYK